MNANATTAGFERRRVVLSTLWIFAVLNYLYADVFSLFFNPVLQKTHGCTTPRHQAVHPPPRSRVVARPRLVERLNSGLRQHWGFGRKLTLVSAPAGFGKTTLVAEWVAGFEQLDPKVRVAWLSLDEGDSDPARFLAYFIGALQTIVADFGAGVLVSLQAPQPPPIEVILTALVNEIAALPTNAILVLDDYHAVDSKQVDQAVAFLAEHLPPQMHLLIATREDPQLPLARWRGRGQMAELRASDLRFTPAEATEFLNQVMDLNLSAEDVAALESRTEGWIAGLQLAALALQGTVPAHGIGDKTQGDASAALAVLEPLLRQMEVRGWADERLKVMALQTVALHANGETERAVQVLCEALALAEHGGFIRLFVDEGAPMAQILAEVAERGVMPRYVGKLLLAFGEVQSGSEKTQGLSRAQPLVEPLSQRELEILRLIAQGLSNQEIGERLFLALDTVKGHNRRIFDKLQVERRTEAVERARKLGLL